MSDPNRQHPNPYYPPHPYYNPYPAAYPPYYPYYQPPAYYPYSPYPPAAHNYPPAYYPYPVQHPHKMIRSLRRRKRKSIKEIVLMIQRKRLRSGLRVGKRIFLLNKNIERKQTAIKMKLDKGIPVTRQELQENNEASLLEKKLRKKVMMMSEYETKKNKKHKKRKHNRNERDEITANKHKEITGEIQQNVEEKHELKQNNEKRIRTSK